MTQQERGMIVGIHVCKAKLDVFEQESGRVYSIGNDAASIKTWLDAMRGRMRLAIEPTHRYHEAVAEAAYSRGMTCIGSTRTAWHIVEPGSADRRRLIRRTPVYWLNSCRENAVREAHPPAACSSPNADFGPPPLT